MVTKTVGKLHFTDLEPGRFEMMTMLMIYRMRRWEKINHYGAAGSDDGIDIEAVELLENGKRVKHHFQCKRFEKLSKSQLVAIAKDYKAKNPHSADYYYVVCGCTVSKTAIEGFDKQCEQLGIENATVWSASYLEAVLYSDYHDILFAFFGVDMTGERNNTISAIRRNVALKKRMHKDFQKQYLSDEEKKSIRNGRYELKFINSNVLIRSIYDTSYPEDTFERSGHFRNEVYNWYHNGLEVHTLRGGVMARVKGHESVVKLDEFGRIPYENIIEYDIDGDEYYRFPHLYCDYPCGSNPYEEIVYRDEYGFEVGKDDIIEIL